MELEPFEFVPHTADVAVVVRGMDLADLMRNAARALYVYVGATARSANTVLHTVYVDSIDRDALVVDWLNELIYFLYVEHTAFAVFRFDQVSEICLVVRCEGERLPPRELERIREVKAATYHGAHITGADGTLHTQVIFDV